MNQVPSEPEAESREDRSDTEPTGTESGVLDEILLTEPGGLPSEPAADASNRVEQRKEVYHVP